MRILIAEDELELNQVLVKRLKMEQYGVDSCQNGEDALLYIEATEYDAVILDIMMPKMDGLTVLRKMRETNINYPVLLLTAKDTVEDRVKGLDAGAEDYRVNPFAFEEWLSRIRVLTRKQTESSTNVYKLAD